MKFPLADWIDSHRGCRHDLSRSGMDGTIRHPSPTASEVRNADPEALVRALADDLGVASDRVFLTHGATEADSAVVLFAARRGRRTQDRACRVRYPEYPPLFDVAAAAGFVPTDRDGPASLAVISQPRNPEGDLWGADRLSAWAEGARTLLVDETFREFTGSPSIARRAGPGVWTSGTFTKFYAGDDLRVGFLVAPEAAAQEYGRFHGLLFDAVPPYSVAGALATLGARARIRREVDRVLEENRASWRRAFPKTIVPAGPVGFDREIGGDGARLATAALRDSVLVCPGHYFGDPTGVRLCLTRRSFSADLEAYLTVRERSAAPSGARSPRPTASRGVRRRPGGSGRARASRA